MAFEGGFDFNKTSLAPPGTNVIIHEKPGQLNSWDPHGLEGWYLVPSIEHYRLNTVYVNKTRVERISDTEGFSPEHNKIPGMSNQEAATNVAIDLI